ncbi:MAG: LytTR family DNA-binding domain-containing protein, partial [Oscillospiraceae bacterium]|nr:LytTR family DNA-binding domain-containing protein [Oscillospiraceae bacterium]
MTTRIAICDDESPMYIQLCQMLNEYGEKREIEIHTDYFGSGNELLKTVNEYDVILMDYQMPGLDGIETSRIIKQSNPDCCLIFVSAYIEAAIDSHEVNTFRFLLKPVDKDKMFKYLDDYVKSIDRDHLLILKTREGAWKIKMSDIIYAEAKGKHTVIRTTAKVLEINMHLKKVEEMLPPEKFIRCQRAYIAGFTPIQIHTDEE